MWRVLNVLLVVIMKKADSVYTRAHTHTDIRTHPLHAVVFLALFLNAPSAALFLASHLPPGCQGSRRKRDGERSQGSSVVPVGTGAVV